MTDVIDLNERRNAASQPDPEHVRKDEYGRTLNEYLLDYESGGSHWSTTIWAYDEEEAKQRIVGMRESLKYMGQLFTVIPA